MKTADLTGVALDWAVAKSEGKEGVAHMNAFNGDVCIHLVRDAGLDPNAYAPSTDWSQGGSIIEREKLNVVWSPLWKHWLCEDKRNAALSFNGPTFLIAAMRCYVASWLGGEVELPKEVK